MEDSRRGNWLMVNKRLKVRRQDMFLELKRVRQEFRSVFFFFFFVLLQTRVEIFRSTLPGISISDSDV